MKSVCTNARHCAWACAALCAKARGNGKITCAIPFVNGQSILPRLPQSSAHTCSPSISFILGSRCMYLKPFLCIGALFVLSQHQITRTCVRIYTHSVFLPGTMVFLGWGSSLVDKGRGLISSLRHTSHTKLRCNYSCHPCWPSAPSASPQGAGVCLFMCLMLWGFVLLQYVGLVGFSFHVN